MQSVLELPTGAPILPELVPGAAFLRLLHLPGVVPGFHRLLVGQGFQTAVESAVSHLEVQEKAVY